MTSKGQGPDEALEGRSDEELIELFLSRGGRDERPFAELFRRHRGVVWRAALGFFGNPDDAEDMTQDVFFTAYRKLDQFKGEAAFRTWLHRIAVNKCKNELRRRSRRLRTVADPLDEAAASAVNGSPGPEAVVASRRAIGRLASAIASLTPDERRLLEQVDVEERPYREIADADGVSVSAVKMRVLRARARLRRALEAGEGERYE